VGRTGIRGTGIRGTGIRGTGIGRTGIAGIGIGTSANGSGEAGTAPAVVPYRRTIGRSLRLLRAFRLEQADPDRFYTLLASDAVRLLGSYVDLAGKRVLDVGGGAGYLTAACRSASARAVLVEPSGEELHRRGPAQDGAVFGDGLRLPVRDGAVDVVLCQNVLEHTPSPYALCAELIRSARPGGLVWISFTNWYSPWGGHETSPWHYRGGEAAARRYRERRGQEPKNRFGQTLFPVHIGETLRWARERADVEVLAARPRYHPTWAAGVTRVPGLRVVATWNLELLLRRVG
jgi:SAM-dependent methyltransferase